MSFDVNSAIEILERTPIVFKNLLDGISTDWTNNNEGKDTWSPYDVIGHLIHGEKTDWIPRLKIILSNQTDKSFEPYDRFAQFEMAQGKSIDTLLQEFEFLRNENINSLRRMEITKHIESQEGLHPEFGAVTIRQMISAWVVHDLGHITQISRVMAKQYSSEVGPWTKYLTILNSTPKE
jgi:hypothetical protein